MLSSNILSSIGCVCSHEVSKAARHLHEIDERLEGKFCKDLGEGFGRKAVEIILVRRLHVGRVFGRA